MMTDPSRSAREMTLASLVLPKRQVPADGLAVKFLGLVCGATMISWLALLGGGFGYLISIW